MAPQTRDGSSESVLGGEDAANDDDVAVTAPSRKKRRAEKTDKTNKSRPIQVPTTPPRCSKIEKGALTSIISYEAAAELTGEAQGTVDSPPTDSENDADVSDDDEREAGRR